MAPRKEFYEFGAFRIERSECLLRRDSLVVPLPPKAVQLLMVLLEYAGDAVQKQTLLERVWPDTFVEEGSLAQNVSLLRKALGDSPSFRCIETLPRRGYRFVAPVRTVRVEPDDRRSLAVLPLANFSGDRSQDFFADGMAEELIGCLMKIEALRVASRTSVFACAVPGKPLGDIARQLGVEWIVEGAVVQADGRVRISVHLIDCATEKQLWTGAYERDLRDVLALQGEVASDIAREIRVTLSEVDHARIASRQVDAGAYDAYLRGRYFWNRRTRTDLARALDYFALAIERDPSYAPAHAGQADTYALLGTVGFDVMKPADAMPRARAAAVRALEIDDTVVQAHVSLGYVKLSYDWDWRGAEQQFQRALDRDPWSAAAHHWHGHCLFAMGRLDGAEREMRRALELDPLAIPFNLGVGWALYYQRRYDEAIAQYTGTREIAPDLPLVLYELGLAHQNRGDYEQALALFEQADAHSGGEPAGVMLLGHLHAKLGNHDAMRQQLSRLDAIAANQYVPALYRAFICAGDDHLDQAFTWFDRACLERSSYLIYLAIEPSLDRLRDDPRFADLARRIGLPAPLRPSAAV